ncbi:TPA: adenosylhomocysteinase [Candidatus Micrarchaeota archaeon]|nr:MAG: adenosylhomocysteinase [Candidatus Micrarchaeota archaeon CG1_02_51_15]HII39040.1 adenosylhomocysteinase [Candidatus Micrarchaeota archaeon]
MTKEHIVKDISLAPQGKVDVEWAERHMPVLLSIRKRFEAEKPLKGMRIAACLHVTKETAVLMRTLRAGGAEVALCASNPLSTQDEVAAALAADGFKVYAVKGMDNTLYYECLNSVLDIKPTITIDDGADLINAIHSKRQDLIPNLIAGQEETTTGVIRLKAMAKAGALKYSVIAVNDTPTKHMFDNHYGTSQSTIDGIIRATNELLAGKVFVVVGYGFCGKGLARGADGLGAKVVVVEVNAVEALKAHLDGFQVMTIADAAKVGDIFCTVTGNKHVIRGEHFKAMKDGAVVCNSGHFDIELNLKELDAMKKSKRELMPLVEEYVLDNSHRVIVLAQGRLVNLACAKGHPSEVMDMSFSDQALCSEYIAKNGGSFKEKRVYDVPASIDETVAKLKLKAHGLGLDTFTAEQVEYMNSYTEGT